MTVQLEKKDVQLLHSRYSLFVFDCDGVLWKGTEPIEGCAEMIERLKKNKRVMFATNNSLHSTDEISAKLARMGIKDISEEDILCPVNVMPFMARKYVDADATIAVFGGASLVGCIQEALGHDHTVHNWESIHQHYFKSVAAETNVAVLQSLFGSIDISVLPSVFVIGYDAQINWCKIAYVTRVAHLREQQGLKTTILQSNGDVTLPCSWGFLPGAGSLFAPYRTALTNFHSVQILDCGKPERPMADAIIEQTGVAREEICMIGDNLFTDIKFGRDHLGASVLVLTGVHKLSDCDINQIYPDFSLDTAAHI